MLKVIHNALLSDYTRFGIGGPVDTLIDVPDETSFLETVRDLKISGTPFELIGGGSNLLAADEGYRGVILRYTADGISLDDTIVRAGAGALLQTVVDFTIDHGLAGIHTMTGIPGWVGGAIYGNAGAYGRSIDQSVLSVRYFDGECVRSANNAQCEFRYRESTFKDHKGWIVFSTDLQLTPGDAGALQAKAGEILSIRNAKYPPTMKCAGSIFKNLILAELPEHVRRQIPEDRVLGGKVPSAWFLEQIGAKGMRLGDIRVADYHANLIYNDGRGKAADVRAIVCDLKDRVRDRYGFELEEEVQYLGGI